jgi:D-aminopeptidase
VDRVHRVPRAGRRRRALRRMHARAGTAEGVLNHTVSGPNFQNLWFNGTSSARRASTPRSAARGACPVLLVTGDQAACRRAASCSATGSRRCRSSAAPAS